MFAQFAVELYADLLGGVTVLRGTAQVIDASDWDQHPLYRHNKPAITQPIEITAIPYCVWDNRAAGEMRVWFRQQ